jgi:hypothetical protein
MRPIGKRQLLRPKVAAKPTAVLRAPISNLPAPTEQLKELIEYMKTPGVSTCHVMIPSDGDDSAGSGGSGGCRNVSFAPEPFSGAA